MPKRSGTERLTWLLGAAFLAVALPLAAVAFVLPIAGKVALALEAGPDPAALAARDVTEVGDRTKVAQRVELSTSTVTFNNGTPTAKVTGGGTIMDRTRNFGFVANGQVGGSAKGNLNYVNHVSGVHVNGPVTSIISFVRNADGTGSATFSGTCRKGCSGTYTVEVEDNNEPGKGDKYGITYSGAGGSESISPPVTLSGGNIQIHPPQ